MDYRQITVSLPIFYPWFTFRILMKTLLKHVATLSEKLIGSWAISEHWGGFREVVRRFCKWACPFLPSLSPDIGKRIKMLEINGHTAKNRRRAGNSQDFVFFTVISYILWLFTIFLYFAFFFGHPQMFCRPISVKLPADKSIRESDSAPSSGRNLETYTLLVK